MVNGNRSIRCYLRRGGGDRLATMVIVAQMLTSLVAVLVAVLVARSSVCDAASKNGT